MANRKFRTAAFPVSSSNSSDAAKSKARNNMRRLLVEDLEARRLMAVGPQLIGVQPNNSDLLTDGAVRNEAPRELTFRFDDAQVIDAATLSGIRITRSGGDGTFGQYTNSTDFGTSGAVNVQLTARAAATAVTLQFSRADLGVGVGPTFASAGNVLGVTLNSNPTTPTTAAQLISAINLSPTAAPLVIAKLNGGLDTAVIGTVNPSSYSPVLLTQSNDTVVQPGNMLVGNAPNQNEVTVRFADSLPDDTYRVEVFGFDDPVKGIVGLRNVASGGGQGDLFKPTQSGTRQDTLDFRLDLGPQVTAVVPQPVVRNSSGALEQQRDTIVVYFDSDKLYVANDSSGNPAAGSAENTAFYQLIYTSNTVRNTDDLRFSPLSAKYNSTANTVTLRFAQDLNLLPGSNAAQSTYRLRIGTRESAPITPTRMEAAATVISDFNTGGAVKFRFTSKALGEAGSGVNVVVSNSNGGGAPIITSSGRTIFVDLNSSTLTADQLLTALRTSSAATNLVSIDLEPGSNAGTIVGNRTINYSPLTLYGVGSSFDTATNLGTIGSAATSQTSLIVTSDIDPVAFNLDLLGANNDPGHAQVPTNAGNSFDQHINDRFGADKIPGVTTILYNFKTNYAVDSQGNSLVSATTEKQKARVREALSIWSDHLGVQFIETPDQGITIATGSVNSALFQTSQSVVRQAALSFGVFVDPTFASSLLVLDASKQWGDNYGEDYFRTALTGLGMLLGLERAGDLPVGTLMALDSAFINGTSNKESIFPGNYDIEHGQYIFRPDSNDIDLYRFDVDFGGADRVGLFTAETFAERLSNSSPLDTVIQLYRQKQATALSNFGVGENLQIQFTAVQPGRLGNNLQIFVTRSSRGANALPIVTAIENTITVDLNSTPGSETTVAQLLTALAADTGAAKLVSAKMVRGSASTVVGSRDITYSPITLLGGDMELVSQNDDYFSHDSYINQNLSSGVYYLGISASGNSSYDATIKDTGFGGRTQGKYELRVNFRAQVDATDSIRDAAGSFAGDTAVTLDGDGDGQPGGVYDFWFQTRPLDRTMVFNAGASASLEGKTITLTGASGVVRVFEFSSDATVGIGNTRIPYTLTSTAGDLADSLATAIRSRSELGINAVANGVRMVLQGERSVVVGTGILNIDVLGRTLFVDKSAGPNSDGSLSKPFNNIAGTGVANAFAAAQPGDIVRIVGNGGGDGKLETANDNFAYEVGFSLINGVELSDGSSLDVPKGVTMMVDAGAVFKMRRSRLGTGSSNQGIDRSGGAIQILGTPALTSASGNLILNAAGNAASGSVFFTSWLDETTGYDSYAPSTTPSAGDWGGISFRRDVDDSSGRPNLEDQGIFLQYVNHADIRYGGGGNVVIDSIQQVVNPIHIVDMRPTVTFNKITRSADAAMSAAPNSFVETNFQSPEYQLNGEFTSDYDRVGPEIHHNTLSNNSINGLFIRVETPAANVVRPLTVSARFDDIDIPHIISENIAITGTPGGAILDTTKPPANLIALAPLTGGTLTPGTYNYKISYVDKFGYETPASDPTSNLVLPVGQTAIQLFNLPSVSGDYVARRVYRSDSVGSGVYKLVQQVNATDSSFIDRGQEAGGTLVRDRANVTGVTAAAVAGTGIPVGTYNYRIVMIDEAGRESIASNATVSVTTTAANGNVRLDNLPLTQAGYAGRRIYRSAAGGAGTYILVAELRDTTNLVTSSIVDNGANLGTLSPLAFGNQRPRTDAGLVVDPGTVVKLEGSRIEIGQGAHLIAEGTVSLPVIFTSKLDDRYGAGGTFDTNNDGSATSAAARDWGGIYAGSGSKLNLDHAVVAYAGGVTKLEGTFKAFNPIEIQAATARIANSTFEFNADGTGGQGPVNRLGRLDNDTATIFIRGAQPVIVGNVFRSNRGIAIDINANSMTDDLMGDTGRATGNADRATDLDSNRGPLVRRNRLTNNDVNGLEIRGDQLTTASVWDDTDIVHVLRNGVTNAISTGMPITVTNLHHEGGLRLQSSPNESLVVKLIGYGSNFDDNAGVGITATGYLTNADDRVGGTVEILGQPGFPVVMTSFRDDTVGAGLQPDGTPQTDTNNDGIATVPRASDWRSVLLDQYSNDRNVATVLEIESQSAVAPGLNGTTNSAQVLGALASRATASDENLRLGFVVQGVLAQPEDQDVYSFTGEAGTEVWIDADQTTQSLDLVIEVLDASGRLLARSDNSGDETADPSLLVKTSNIDPNFVNPLQSQPQAAQRTNASGSLKEDGTINPRDAGMRLVLPGAAGNRSTYYFRVRSASLNPNDSGAGLTSGTYTVQLRLREAQEFPGSTVQYADIRYATNGIELRGLPQHSPLLGEVQEDESASNTSYINNDVNNINFGTVPGVRDQYVGNLLQSDRSTISIGGRLSSGADIDFYRFDVSYAGILGGGTANLAAPVVFDMDYADGINRPDTSLWVYRVDTDFLGNSTFTLIYGGTDSNIADDRRSPLTLSDLSDLSRGSVGSKDPFIGSAALGTGTYAVAVSSAGQVPAVLSAAGVRRLPLNSVLRVADDSFETLATAGTFAPPTIPQLFDRTFIGTTLDPNNLWHTQSDFSAGHNGSQVFNFGTFGGGSLSGSSAGELVSNAFSLGSYSNEDLPTLYFNYNLPLFTAGFSVYIQNAAGQRTQLTNSLGLTTGAWTQSRLDLSKVTIAGQSVAGQDGLRLVFAYDAAAGTGGGVSIDDVVIGFAERGEQIIGAAAGSAFTAVAVPNGTITSGEYQLEIRTGEDFFTSSATGLTLTKTFDTNDRAAPQLTIVAPEGRAVNDGDTFYLQVDGQRVTFEFSTDGVVTPGNVALNITGTEADYEIARKIRDAVNDPSVQSRVKVKAAFSSGLESGTAGKDNRVNLFGNVTGNFQTYSTKTMSITSVTNNANTLRNQIFGTGITATTPAVYTGGNQSAAIVNLGSDTGILLSTGNVNSLTAPNTNDNASGISSNAGNPDINAALGITSTDSTSLEMKFQFGDGTVGGDLFMDLMFASEEYNEAVSRDRLVVLVDGVNIALVPSTASPINSATVNRNTNSKYFYNNDPSDGGKYLYQNGFDGFTSLFTLSKLGLASGEHTLKVIIADTVTTGTDSAVFIRTGSVSSSARVQNSAPLQAIFYNGTSDQNTNRDQGQVLIQNNYIRDSRDYAIWSEPGTRQNDPRDLIANRAPGFTGVMQNIPGIGSGSLGAVRNLLELNNTIPGGFSPGIVVSNNVMEHGGLGGVNVAGELPIFMITPSFIPGPGTSQPSGDHSIGSNTNPFDHFGSFLDDGDILVVDGGRNRVRFEFEDIAGAGVGSPTFGSGQVQGNGYADTSVPVYYREDGGQQYLRLPTSPNNPGYSALETLEGLRDSILGSILVTNGTTQHITATIAPALLAPDTTALPSGATPGYPNYYNKPALYLEGATAITFINAQGGGNPFNIRRVDAAASTQPFARIVNNTIIGNDGRESFAATSTVNEPNDTIATAVDTWQGTAHNPQTFTLNASIGDSSQFRAAPSQDVDLYKFKLDIGERVIVDIDSPANGGVDSVLQIFDAQGRVQSFTNSTGQLVTFSDNDIAPGEGLGVDPYADFTATAPGVYYAALSGKGNVKFDPLSLANRVSATSTGAYAINLSVLQPQQFTITVRDQSAYPEGSTFTISQVADFAGTNNNSRTFEFTRDNVVSPGNIPINIDANYRRPDVARAIAGAINGGGPGGTPVLQNIQSLANGAFGTASPLAAVSGKALGGASGVESGLTLFARRNDGNLPTHSSNGIGHDRQASGQLSNTSLGDGTTEMYVVVNNAANIRGNGTILVDPDINDNYNLDQILPETGVFASRGASPTLMNNVFVNVQTPIVREETRRQNGVPAPFGSNAPDVHPKVGEVIIGGSLYQFADGTQAKNRLGEGIETSPTNLPNTSLDFNYTASASEKLFVDAQAGLYLPAPGSRLIDSSLDVLEEREAFKTIKQAMGIAVSPIIAPARDATGQLRVDDPSVATPSGQGANVFKDRGALDRADFVGPSANIVSPQDNDALGNDQDTTVSVIQLTNGVYPEFRIQLVDGFEAADPFPGIGIDDSTVVGPNVAGVRSAGAAVTVFENGRLLVEGIDYTFAYDTTKNEVILTPLAGVWKNDRVYQVNVNNKDRFVLTAPAGDQLNDGQVFTVTDSLGGVNYFEYDSGYRLQIPQGLTLQAPLAGGATGGIADGDRFTINDGVRTVTFEFDRNGNFLAGNVPILFTLNSTRDQIAQAVYDAIRTSTLAVTPRLLSGARVFIGAETNTRLNTNFTAMTQPSTTLGLKIPDLGPRPGGITDGQTFTVNDGRTSMTFEYDNDGLITNGNVRIDISAAGTVTDLSRVTQAVLASSGLKIKPTIISTDVVHLGLNATGSVSVGTSKLTILGVARTLTDGQTFTVSDGATTKTFEFTRDANVTAGNIAISVALSDTQDEIGARTAAAIAGAGLGLTPIHVGDGNIDVKGTSSHTISTAGAPVLGLYGAPGVQSNTRLEVFGPLMLQVPTRGGVDIVDGRLFTISNNGRTVIFEFDNNGFGPSTPGNVLVRYTPTSTANDVALAIIAAIQSTALGLTPINLGGGKIELGILNTSQVVVGSTGMTTSRGVVSDGESFTIDNGSTAITFEFDNVDLSNGSTAGRTPILFRSNSTPDSVVATMKAVIEGTTLGLTTTVMPNGVIQLNDTPRFVITTTNAPSLRKTGVPGGANAVFFIQDSTFTADMVKRSIITAVNNALNTNLQASDRGGSTLFLENAISVSPEIDNYYLQGVSDLAGNALKPNRINNETEFTILMPGAELDYGDAPDPFTTTGGRYPTERTNDGARHVISQGTAWLGTTADADNDGNPTPAADGDVGDDGVTFGSALNPLGLFNRFITTNVTVTMNSSGYVDGWIDFNADGDWDDPGEKILDSVQFVSGNLTQTFAVTVPATAPVPLTATTTFARFRSSTTGGLLPTGLAVDGEVEDYQVTVVPGTPPTAVNDTYTINEDSLLLTTDADGAASPGFVIDDGIAANDTDPEGGPFQVALVTGPTHAQSFTLNPDGTFTYVPAADFNGSDVFTYRVKDGVLTSNNVGTVTITVREVNDAPTANNDTVLTDEDSPLTLLESQLISNDVAGPAEESGQTLHVTGVQSLSAAGGAVSLSGGRVIYTPPADFSGTDTFTYTITDNGTSIGLPAPLSATATVTVTVRDVNDAPITGGDTIGPVVEDGSIGVSTGTLLGNDAAGPLNETLVQAIRMNRVIATSSNGGTVTLSGTTVTYRPAPDFAGTDTFFYEVVDNGLSNGVSDPKTALGTVTVTVTPVNDAPRVSNSLGTVTVIEDSPARTFDLSTYFFDPDVVTNGDVLTYSVKSNTNTNLATPTISANTLTVPLVADANGQAVITIEATDSTGAKITNTLTLNVTPVNDAPRLVTAVPDQTMAEDETPRTITLSPTFFRDPDVASNGDRLTYSLTENTNSLLVTPTLNSSGDLTLTLSANQFGTSQISVKVTDLAGLFVTDTFILTVNPVNDAPIGRADAYTVAQGGTLITTDLRGSTSSTADDSVLVNDTDIESDPMTSVLVTGPQFGTVTLNSNGTFTYVHTGSTRTTDTFTYRPNDGALSGNLTTVTITIGAPAAPPHQNPLTVGSESSDGHRDVNADGFISPIDALLVINFLNTEGPRSVVGLPSPPPYRDVNGDNFISAIDALLVINYLNSLRPSGEGEGEAALAGDVQTGNWLAAAYANEFVATRAASSSYVSMRTRDLAPGEIYGPVQPVLIRDEVVEAIAATGLAVDSDVAALLAAEPVHSGDSAGAVDSAISELLGDLFPKIDKKS